MAASLAISALSAGAAHDAGRRQANQQSDALRDAAYLQGNDLQRQQSQQGAAAAEQMNEHAREAAGDMARAQTIAGEYGGGNSVDRGMAVLGMRAGEGLATIASNAGMADEQTRFDALASTRRTASQLASTQRPSNFGTALQIGGAAVNARAQYLSMTKPTVKPTVTPKP